MVDVIDLRVLAPSTPLSKSLIRLSSCGDLVVYLVSKAAIRECFRGCKDWRKLEKNITKMYHQLTLEGNKRTKELIVAGMLKE